MRLLVQPELSLPKHLKFDDSEPLIQSETHSATPLPFQLSSLRLIEDLQSSFAIRMVVEQTLIDVDHIFISLHPG